MRRFFVSFVTVQLRSFDVFPFLSVRKFRHFDRKQERDPAGCEGSTGQLLFGSSPIAFRIPVEIGQSPNPPVTSHRSLREVTEAKPEQDGG
ncbi:hypothetical protein KFK09_018597 [Dendrobium nobile]|uniref:Uncharacterized protein n=1 Tax=Dendrobium nobile TaxID=94219 RepID=A0A8T3B1M8_DENNO|nr:hypothetical protein KFK09_018597 [Dendrobium nobile]